MLLLQTDVLGGNKLNCFKATQVLGDPTQILIWGSELAKGLTRGGTWSFGNKGRPKTLRGPMNPNDAMRSQCSLL